MNVRLATLIAVALLSGCVPGSIDVPAPPLQRAETASVARAHAHNDYDHERPLFEALDQGFASVEADVFSYPGLGLDDLYVAHNVQDVRVARTLKALYLEPLAQLVRDNGGSVHGDGQPFYLLIDIKTAAEGTYAEIDRQLRDYAFMLTQFTPAGMTPGAITVAISGNRPAETMRAQALRYAGYDGRMSDLDSADPASFMPLLSDNWNTQFSWKGAGAMPADQRARLREQVGKVHAAGRRIRYWETPDAAGPEREAVWHELLCAGADHLNSDDLAGLSGYLRANDPPKDCD
jgi:glycerophosphoryl diester phosphodiesterase